MKICITVGHSRLKNGSYTSADGTKYGGVNEYKWCKNFSKNLKNQLKKKGHAVDVVICPEKKFTTATQEKTYKLNIVNKKNYDLIMELHLNASDNPTAYGAEVLYKSASGKKYADKVMKSLSKTFRARGSVKRNDLYMLNGTKAVCIMIETFFCTNKSDYLKAKGMIKRRKIAKDIANVL